MDVDQILQRNYLKGNFSVDSKGLGFGGFSVELRFDNQWIDLAWDLQGTTAAHHGS